MGRCHAPPALEVARSQPGRCWRPRSPPSPHAALCLQGDTPRRPAARSSSTSCPVRPPSGPTTSTSGAPLAHPRERTAQRGRRVPIEHERAPTAERGADRRRSSRRPRSQAARPDRTGVRPPVRPGSAARVCAPTRPASERAASGARRRSRSVRPRARCISRRPTSSRPHSHIPTYSVTGARRAARAGAPASSSTACSPASTRVAGQIAPPGAMTSTPSPTPRRTTRVR